METLTTPIPSRRPARVLGAAAVLAALCLLSGALPATAQKEGDQKVSPDHRERQMIVLSEDGSEIRPRVITRVLGRGFLGVELTSLTPELRTHFGVPDDRGVMIGHVEDDSPAARAGLQVGDIITGIDGEKVDSPWDLSAAVRKHEGGEDADLEVWRDGRSLDFRVTIAERSREQIDLGQIFELRKGDGPDEFLWRQGGMPDGAATLYFQPETVERLRESLDKIDWPQLDRKLLVDRNQELEERLENLEKRLKELEEELKHSDR